MPCGTSNPLRVKSDVLVCSDGEGSGEGIGEEAKVTEGDVSISCGVVVWTVVLRKRRPLLRLVYKLTESMDFLLGEGRRAMNEEEALPWVKSVGYAPHGCSFAVSEALCVAFLIDGRAPNPDARCATCTELEPP